MTSFQNTAALRLALPLEIKLAGAPQGVLAGYASTFGGPPDTYGDVVAPGAFTRTLAEHRAAGTMPVLLWAHDQARPIGRWTRAEEDDVGLFMEGRLNLETSAGKDAHAHLAAGDVAGLSIGFMVPDGGRKSNGTGAATIVDADLLEVSVVSLPANSRARVASVKSIGSKAELRDLLRDHLGISREAARRVADGGWAALAGADDEQTATAIIAALRASAERMKGR